MSSTYDELNVRTTEEILKNNVRDLQGQLVNANKRVASLRDTLNNIINMHKDIEYKLQGIEIYVHDIKELIDDQLRR